MTGAAVDSTGAERLYVLAGLRSTLFDGTDMLSEWKVRRVAWPLSTAAITDLVNLIRLQACTSSRHARYYIAVWTNLVVRQWFGDHAC